ncbi:MAG TPA: TonB-dependent receptor plug domain-containing protein [Ferruginibacter sp.]|nr:TonB-dependent receptor plug domain-containing protein [Ferruginibacter sp.]
MQFRIILMAVTCLVISTVTQAQTNIRGKIVDAVSRQPLEGVSVTDAGTTTGKTISDPNGNFVLASAGRIIITYIGYRSLAIDAEKNKENIIGLHPDLISLKDVVLESKAASRFSTISKIDLDLKPVKNTQELLRTVPGLFIAQHAGGGKAEQIFLRGFDCDHGTDVQVSVDGIPVNMVSHAHGQGYADAHFIIPETINNIDFGAGPYYTKHGNLNTAGYVAFSTFKNIPKSMIQVEGGRFNSFRTLAMIDLLKKNKDKQSAYIAADYNYTDGPTLSKQRFKRLNLFGKYNAVLSAATQLSFSASAFSSNWDASGQVPDRAVKNGTIDRFGSIDPSEGGNTERYNANLVLSTQLKKGGNWQNQFFYSHYIFNLYSNFTFFLADPVNGDGINQAEKRDIFGYSSTLAKKCMLGRATLNSTDGIGLRYDATSNSRLSTAVNRQFIDNIKLGDVKELNVFAFTDQQLSIGKWLINAGLRLDYFNFKYLDRLVNSQLPSQSKAILSPKMNIQYSISKAAQVYIKGGKGFHSNDARVVVENSGKQILPAAYGADLGVMLKPVDNLFLNIAAWYLYLDQEFVYVGDAGVIEPSGKSKRQGIDVLARYQFTKNLFATVNINYTKPRAIDEPKGANYIPLAPTLTSVGGIYYKQKTGFNGGISYRYIKNRPANEDNSITAKGYFLLDASVNYTRPKYEIGFAVENILNIKWNEAQFATESQLRNETAPVNELHYTPGTPLFARLKLAVFF